MSRVARGLSLVVGGAVFAQDRPATIDRLPGGLGERWRLPALSNPILSELFATHPRDGGWAGFLLAQIDSAKPLLWIQDRMSILESGRIHPPGMPTQNLIHVEASNARDALWAMEEGVRCSGLSGVVGELWGDPAALDFTATRRLAVTAERSRVPCWLIRLGGTANLSGARMRWRVASSPSSAHPLNPRAPGASAWDCELFRARGAAPGRWVVGHDPRGFHLVAAAGDRALGEERRFKIRLP